MPKKKLKEGRITIETAEVDINYPHKAYLNFKKLMSDKEFSERFVFIRGILDRISDPVKRARKAHQYVESYTNESLNSPVAKKLVTCHKGCDACCHTQVSVSSDEAQLLASRVVQDNLDIDVKRLHLQGSVGNNAKEWFELPYEYRKCVFLGDKGQCQVYEDRPSVCRTNNVLSSPKLCETKDGLEQPIRLLNTEKADIATIAAYQSAGEGGALPSLLWKYLSKLPEAKVEEPKSKKISKKRLKKIKKDLSKIFEL